MADQNRPRNPGEDGDPAEARSPRVRLPGFVNDDDIGLGDAMKRVFRIIGIRPCRGCEQRAAALNRWLVLSGRSGRRR